jgi:hypothetical protein
MADSFPNKLTEASRGIAWRPREADLLDIVTIGQPEVLLRRDVAQQRRAQRADSCRANGGRNVIVRGCDVRGQGSKRVEGRLVAPLELLGHVLRNLVKRYVAGTLVHDLHSRTENNASQQR